MDKLRKSYVHATYSIVRMYVVTNLLQQVSYLKRLLYEDEISKNLIKFRDFGIFSNKEYEEKVRIYNQLRSKENFHNDEKILINLLEKGIITKEEYEKKVKVIKDIFETEIWANSTKLFDLKKKTGITNIKRYAEKRETSWMCVCGTDNELSNKNCSECNLNQQYV